MSTPFMQLYVADYLGDTQHLTAEQHGAYLLLLMTMWRHGGSLPSDPKMLARIARVSARRWHLISAEVMDFFDEEDGKITQKRLVEEYQKASLKSEKRSVSGKAGAAAKALKNNKQASANANRLLKHSSEPDILDKSNNARERAETDFEFEEFWSCCPRKEGKGQAEKAYRSARKVSSAAEILAGIRRYYAERRFQDPKYTRLPATWLNGRGWQDEPANVVPMGRPRDLRDIKDPVERARYQSF
jgi:uncharacterized protein YdaU (DUF1376 family)